MDTTWRRYETRTVRRDPSRLRQAAYESKEANSAKHPRTPHLLPKLPRPFPCLSSSANLGGKQHPHLQRWTACLLYLKVSVGTRGSYMQPNAVGHPVARATRAHQLKGNLEMSKSMLISSEACLSSRDWHLRWVGFCRQGERYVKAALCLCQFLGTMRIYLMLNRDANRSSSNLSSPKHHATSCMLPGEHFVMLTTGRNPSVGDTA